jgi:hypothetical protein
MGKKRVGEGAAGEVESTGNNKGDASKSVAGGVVAGKMVKRRAYRKSPLRTYTTSLPEIASALAEKAKEGSYLHARALKELADSDDVQKKRSRRKQSSLAQMLLEQLEARKRLTAKDAEAAKGKLATD